MGGLVLLCLSLLVAQWPRRRARPRFSQIELDPPCGAPNWDKGGWNNKAEPLDCPLTNGKARADETVRAVVCSAKGKTEKAGGEVEVSRIGVW